MNTTNKIMSAVIFGEVPNKKLKCIVHIPVKSYDEDPAAVRVSNLTGEDFPDWEDEDFSGATEQEFGR